MRKRDIEASSNVSLLTPNVFYVTSKALALLQARIGHLHPGPSHHANPKAPSSNLVLCRRHRTDPGCDHSTTSSGKHNKVASEQSSLAPLSPNALPSTEPILGAQPPTLCITSVIFCYQNCSTLWNGPYYEAIIVCGHLKCTRELHPTCMNVCFARRRLGAAPCHRHEPFARVSEVAQCLQTSCPSSVVVSGHEGSARLCVCQMSATLRVLFDAKLEAAHRRVDVVLQIRTHALVLGKISVHVERKLMHLAKSC